MVAIHSRGDASGRQIEMRGAGGMSREQVLRCARYTRERRGSAFAYEPQGQVFFPFCSCFALLFPASQAAPTGAGLCPQPYFSPVIYRGSGRNCRQNEKKRAVRD
jgi:hypothetical protein